MSTALMCGIAAACSSEPSAPRPLVLVPAEARVGQETSVAIRGHGFQPGYKVSYRSPSESVIDPLFSARLGDHALTDVLLVDAENLTAVVPATLPVGIYALVVVAPDGLEGELTDAFTVLTTIGDGGVSDAVASDTAGLDTASVDAGIPDASALDSASPDIAAPDSTSHDNATPDTASPDSAAPDSTSHDSAALDSNSHDSTAPDTASPDSTAPDTASPDSAAPDTPSPDSAAPDTALPDAATPDTTTPDAAAPDTAAPDSSLPDTATADSAGSWALPTCARRLPLTFDNSAQAESLPDVPVLVVLNGGRFSYGDAFADGTDVRFIDGDDSTPLAHEIEAWDPTSDSFVWVRVPLIDGGSDTDRIFMYYSCAAAAGQDPTAVWSADYVGVWHLGEATADGDTSGTHADATANSNHGAQNGNAAMTGPVAGAQHFDGDDYIRVPEHVSLDVAGAITVEGWASYDDFPNSKFHYVLSKYDIDDDRAYALNTREDTPWFVLTNDGLQNSDSARSSFGMDTGQWYYIVGTWDGSTDADSIRLYIDGVLRGSNDGLDPNQLHDSAADVLIGAVHNTGAVTARAIGGIDEVRVMSRGVSADWIVAQHLSMTDAFITFGAVENR